MNSRRFTPLFIIVAVCLIAALLPRPGVWGQNGTPPRGATPTPPPAAFTVPPAIRPKIEPDLLKQLLTAGDDEPVACLVHLRAATDLSPFVAAEVSIQERRRMLVSALQATADETQAPLRAYLAQEQSLGRVERFTPYWIFNGLAVVAQREIILALASRPEVEIVRADHKRYLPEGRKDGSRSSTLPTLQSSPPEWNISRVRADLVWEALGIVGSGVVVANMDTGVDLYHPALLTRYRGYNPKGLHVHAGNWFCATNEGYAYPGDGHSHGTHTMGTIVGGDGLGVAPGAQWIAVKIFTNSGYSYDSWIHAGFQWLLAPNGDPDLAPDVVNNSWGGDNGADETFRPDVQALVAAGIVPIFSAGNDGPYSSSMNAPGSFPETIAVGATDADDVLAGFSSRGPSPWGEIKPEVVAPGVNVRSSVPGGGYAVKSGTSMAAPHVTGIVALMLQANPALSIAQIEQALTSTATPLGSPQPNNEYGWGLVDAYRAVMAVGDLGALRGTVRASSGAPIGGATVSVAPRGGGPALTTTSDSEGNYLIGLAADTYDATATAFGYYPQTAYNLIIAPGQTVTQPFTLTAKPTSTLLGTITEAGSGRPLSATVNVLNSTLSTTASAQTGGYSLVLPIGEHEVRVTHPGHRVLTATVTILAGQATIRDFSLPTAPTILLVDSGPYYNDSQRTYFESALDELRYLYDEHLIRQPYVEPRDVPTADQLMNYDIVIWSSPRDAPGYVGASTAITNYLTSGGRLFLTGQDVAYWDDGGSGLFYASYFHKYIMARYVRDDTGIHQITGLPDDIFSGLSLTITGEGGANNQLWPDEVRVHNADHARAVLTYQDDGQAGQCTDLCRPYRVLYLPFGFEAINDATTRRQVMQRTIDWLMSPRQTAGVELTPTLQTVIGPPGTAAHHVLRLRNTGELAADTYSLSLSPSAWPASLSADHLTLASCATDTLTVTVQIPAGTDWNASDTVVLTATSSLSPTLVHTATLITKTPAPILLVDDDRWYHVQDYYTAALQANALAYDYWNVGWDWGDGLGSPPLSTLQWYPIVVWFTGYDWAATLSADEEANLLAYLDNGGRLFFSSQDYLYTNGLTDLGGRYLGVISYTEDLTSTVVTGVQGNPVGDSLGPYTLTYPFRNWSDALTPTIASEAAFLGDHGYPVAVAHQGDRFRTVFFSFPFEALDQAAAQLTMERVIGWLSWLGTSTFSADRTPVASGSTVTYTLVMRNDHSQALARATVSNTIPPHTSYVPGSLQPAQAIYHSLTRTITWQGPLAAGAAVTLTYRLAVDDPLPAATYITNVARLEDTDHGLSFRRQAVVRVNAPDLSPSTFTVNRDTARPGDVLTYTIVLRNAGIIDAVGASVSAPVPTHTTYISGSLSALGGGVLDDSGGFMHWEGTVGVGQAVTVTYGVVVRDAWVTVVGQADIEDGYGESLQRQAVTAIAPYQRIFPLIMKGYQSP
ncbi:MAG: S8 family serine peptidase [Anaerolineae bacterium]|nr:S8 family serine peptidase [Anaerolineae bacterium]